MTVLVVASIFWRQGSLDKAQDDLPANISKLVAEQVDSDLQENLPRLISEELKRSLPQQPSSPYPDFDSAQKMVLLPLVKGFESWTPKGVVQPDKAKTVLMVEGGDVARAYLYIRARVGEQPLTQWESVYAKIDNVGGHLFRPLSLPVPSGTESRLLYAVNSVPYLPSEPYSENRKPVLADWSPSFREGAKIRFDVFISSLRPATLDEVALYYECAPQSASCRISVESSE
ncbi:MAG: hypothetical protein WC497_05980 [Patescibacteria group bacterium]